MTILSNSAAVLKSEFSADFTVKNALTVTEDYNTAFVKCFSVTVLDLL